MMTTIALTVLGTLVAVAVLLGIGANIATAEKRLLYRPRQLYVSADADFRRALGILLGPPLVGGNHVTTLVNGDQIFPAMLKAIDSAQVTVTFETFVFRDEAPSRQAAQATSRFVGQVHRRGGRVVMETRHHLALHRPTYLS